MDIGLRSAMGANNRTNGGSSGEELRDGWTALKLSLLRGGGNPTQDLILTPNPILILTPNPNPNPNQP